MALKNPAAFAFQRTVNSNMRDVLDTITRLASSHVNVLITGERGTGKEWAAHLIHYASPRATSQLITVECASLPPDQLERDLFGYESITWKGVDIKPGAFEQASGGTLLLHDIGHVPTSLLMRVSRVVEFQRVRRIAAEDDVTINTRLIATMSVNPQADAHVGHIDREVLHRLSPIHLELMPLRRRREDIPLLVEGFLTEMRERAGAGPAQFSPRAMEACVHFDWPGNIRHLRNAIEYASVMCKSETVLLEHLPEYLHVAQAKG